GLALALALAAKPQLQLELISIVAGNTPREVGFAVATDLLAQSGYQVPVALGAARALSEPPEPWRAHLDRPIADPKLAALWRDLPAPSLANAPAPDAAIAIG
ncbi:nucleoside hydrolase, partial [Serratia marcescens]|nr:nucleoside hydrolase [Serratia marcescens]